jgi:sec-independent protein translocase protein TatA
MIGGIGAQELLLIFLVILLLFGAKRIPDIAHGIGKSMREFRKAMNDTKEEFDRSVREIKDVGKEPEEKKP